MIQKLPDRAQLLNLLQSFVSFHSTADRPNDKKECLDWVNTAFFVTSASRMQRGIHEYSPWLYLPNKNARLLLFAHADVVPAPDALFTLRTEGDSAFGRGVSDMKGNTLPLIMAYRDALAEGEDPPVSILITTDEEVAGTTIPYLLNEGIITAKAAFTPDSDAEGIVCKHKGVVWSQLTVQGKGGHGAYPWKAQNPIWKLQAALETLKVAFPLEAKEHWTMTVTPTMLAGSTARNQIPEQATCGIDIRFTAEEFATAEEALIHVRSFLPEDCTLEAVKSAAPLDTPRDSEMVRLYKRIAEEVLGIQIPFKSEHGGTDARYFGERGIPAFLYGPKGGGLHSDTEWVSISSLLQHYEIYRRLFREL